MAHDSSDSSDDSNYVPSEFDEESDDDIGMSVMSHQKSFNIPVGQEVAGKVVKVLELMEELGINLTTFLDAVSWSNDVRRIGISGGINACSFSSCEYTGRKSPPH